jgi:LysR family transcriptional regulator, glycine cleavage system transcriptional activator
MRNLPSLLALRSFESAGRLESFARAAAELHLTPSAISHQVRALESWLACPLFVRTARRVVLTDAGRRLMDAMTPALDRIEDACAELRPTRTRTLAVHCAPSFATKWLGPRLADFMHVHREITLRFSSSAEPVRFDDDSPIDIDIAYGLHGRQAGMESQPLGVEITAPLCSPAFAKAYALRDAKDIARCTLIDSKLNPVQWADWCRLNSVRLPRSARPSFDRGSLAVAAAADGLGVALETLRFAGPELANGSLVMLDGPDLRHVERPLHFVRYRRTRRHDPTIQAFLEWILDQAEESGTA